MLYCHKNVYFFLCLISFMRLPNTSHKTVASENPLLLMACTVSIARFQASISGFNSGAVIVTAVYVTF